MFHWFWLLILSPTCGLGLLMAEEIKRSIEVRLTLPGSGYSYRVTEVRQVGEELWVLTDVQPKGVGTAAITTAKAKAAFGVPAKLAKARVRQLVRGKTWNWGEATADTMYLKKDQALPANFAKAPLLYQRAKPADKKADKPGGAQDLWIFTMPREKEQRMDEAAARKLASSHGAEFTQYLGAIGMFFAKATEAQAQRIKADPRVSDAEKDR